MQYVCLNCGFTSLRWLGKCPSCNSWNSLHEEPERKGDKVKRRSSRSSTKPICADEIFAIPAEPRISSGISEFDKVIGGGIVPGSVILIGGEPGVGKSTLLLQIASKIAEKKKLVYVSSEESPLQIASRLKRLNEKISKNLYIFFESNIERALDESKNIVKEDGFIFLDSIQSFYSDEIESAPGTVSQVRHVALKCQDFSRKTQTSIVIVGHVTKEGIIAGPKTLEHIVDVVLYLEVEGIWRVLRATKNRFGSTGEIGFFIMSERCLQEVQNPSLFDVDLLSIPGVSLSCVMEGSNIYIVEVQALVSKTHFPLPRRSAQGYDIIRLNNIISVLEKIAGITLYDKDVLLNIAGGIKVSDVSVDLAVASSILSSYYSVPIGKRVIFGEVGLLGEIRGSPFTEQKILEAKKIDPIEIITGKTKMKGITSFHDLRDFSSYIANLPKYS